MAKWEKTLEKIKQQPTVKGLPWTDVKKLFKHYDATIVAKKGGSMRKVKIDGVKFNCHEPHDGICGAMMVNRIREYLVSLGKIRDG